MTHTVQILILGLTIIINADGGAKLDKYTGGDYTPDRAAMTLTSSMHGAFLAYNAEKVTLEGQAFTPECFRDSTFGHYCMVRVPKGAVLWLDPDRTNGIGRATNRFKHFVASLDAVPVNDSTGKPIKKKWNSKVVPDDENDFMQTGMSSYLRLEQGELDAPEEYFTKSDWVFKDYTPLQPATCPEPKRTILAQDAQRYARAAAYEYTLSVNTIKVWIRDGSKTYALPFRIISGTVLELFYGNAQIKNGKLEWLDEVLFTNPHSPDIATHFQEYYVTIGNKPPYCCPVPHPVSMLCTPDVGYCGPTQLP